MGSGACVRVYSRVTRIYIDGTPEDENNVRGLCGNYNGNPNDDHFTPDGTQVTCPTGGGCPDMYEPWRVPPDRDLFNCQFASNPANTAHPIPQLCSCETHMGQDIQCG